jgi:hypothetical protein
MFTPTARDHLAARSGIAVQLPGLQMGRGLAFPTNLPTETNGDWLFAEAAEGSCGRVRMGNP